MNRKPLLDSIHRYHSTWGSGEFQYKDINLDEEIRNAAVITDFANKHSNCFHRENHEGHITGSALVTNRSLDRVLLTHHGRLNKWLQLGGHSDGHPLTWEVAFREAQEESGILDLDFFTDSPWDLERTSDSPPLIFDMDHHGIPAHKAEKAHIHYDVRFLIVASETLPPIVSEESHDVRWFDLTEARGLTNEQSMHRQFNKLDALRKFKFK